MSQNRLGWRFDLKSVEFTSIRVCIPALPDSFHQYRIVQISDFHLGTWIRRQHLEQIAYSVNALHPDLVVITGDFVNHGAEKYAPDLVEALSILKAKDGIISVLGNHDHWTNAEVVRWSLAQSNITELNNSVIGISRNGCTLHFAGIDDHLAGCDDLDAVLDQLPGDGAAILLAHEPDFAARSAKTGKFALQLSGHSHGGQIRLPVIGTPYLPPLGRLYPQGLYTINGMQLYTNRGLGTSWLGLRVNCPPEITILTLDAGQTSRQADKWVPHVASRISVQD